MASWAPRYSSPPPVEYPYNAQKNALSDLPGVSYALELFLASHMHESEDYCNKSDEKKERMYFATGYGLIQCVKGLMSYADEDLLAGIHHTKHGNLIASQHRKKHGFFGSVWSHTGLSNQSAFIKSMTPMERHAELTFAESLFEKALLGIVYSGDWLAFIKEALNMRTTITVYRQLQAFIEEADAAYAASLARGDSPPSSASSSSTDLSTPASFSSANSNSQNSDGTRATESTAPTSEADTTTPATSGTSAPKKKKKQHIEDPSIDAHFRSGVYLGAGMCNIILSLMPGKLQTLVELFGYHGDRKAGLELLMRAGGWDADEAEPSVSTSQEGVRRSICDMALLIFHLVLSSITVECIDIRIAARILEWNLKRYPNGVFFLFGAGRLAIQRSQPREAIMYYSKALKSQTQYRNLHHISFWEIAMARLSLWELGEKRGKKNGQGQGVKKVEAEKKEEKEEGRKGSTEVTEVCEVKEQDVKITEEEEEWADIKDDVSGSAGCWRLLEKEATWSKAIYTYGLAVCLLEEWDTDADLKDDKEREKARSDRKKEASKLMDRVPNLRQKIAGKSIPLEKFVARKARKFTSQSSRLALPALEMAYIFQCIAHAPRSVILGKMLPEVRDFLAYIEQYKPGAKSPTPDSGSGKKRKFSLGKKEKQGPDAYEGGADEFWDDYCLAVFLEGVCLRYLAYPDPDAVLNPDDDVTTMSKEEAEKGSEAAFRLVFENGPQIELDHHLVYFAHYELGRLLACKEDVEGARREFDLVLSGKHLEVGPSGKKGKYSLENALHIRTHAAMDALENSRKRL